LELRLLTDAAYAEQFDIAVDELTEQYAADEIHGEERKRVEKYFLRSEDRRAGLRFALALKEEARRRHKWRAPRLFLLIAASFLVVLGLGVGTWRAFIYQSDVDKGLLALNAAYRDQRPIESRISALNYAPFSQKRGPGNERVDESELVRAKLILLEAQRDKPTPAVHHALGNVYLAQKHFDEAIQEFGEALKGDQRNAKLYNDLGAALLEKAKQDRLGPEPGKSFEELVRSLDNLNKALELDPNLAEGLFNRGLCHESMDLNQDAANDWREYLKRDQHSPWAEEARDKLDRLSRQSSRYQTSDQLVADFLRAYEANDDSAANSIINRTYSSDGNAVTNSLLASLLAPKAASTKQQDVDLARLSYAGQLVRQRANDQYAFDLARFYSSSSTRDRTTLAHANSALKEGAEFFKKSHLDKAMARFATAKELYSRVGNSTEAAFADYRLLHCYVLKKDVIKSRAIFAHLAPLAQQKHYRWLLAQCLYQLASIHIGLTEYSEAIAKSSEALELLEKLNDVNGVIKSLIQLADEYRCLNNQYRSLAFLQQSLTAMQEQVPEPMQCWGTYIAIALNLGSYGFQAAALAYQQEALRLALMMERPLLSSMTYEYLALTYGRLKRQGEAISSIEQSVALGHSLGAESDGLEIIAHASLELGEIYRELGDCGKAIESYDRSLALYKQLNFDYFGYPAHKGKLLCYAAQGQDADTRREIETVLKLFKRMRSTIVEQTQRIGFFDVEQTIYDLAIDFEYSRGNNRERAFEYSESSHARSLLDLLRQGGQMVQAQFGLELKTASVSEPPTLAQMRHDLPEHTQVLVYMVLSNKLLMWVVRRSDAGSSLPTTVVSVDSQVLTQKIKDYLTLLTAGEGHDAELAERARDLHALLIKPIEPWLDKTKLLCVVPDKALNYLPFGALLSQVSGRYLIEDYTLQYSPSVGVFMDCSRIAQEKARLDHEKLLGIANPTFDRAVFPTLADLPSANHEIETIIPFYDSHDSLPGREARANAVKRKIQEANVVQFAGHYVANEQSAMLSHLVLAADPNASDEDASRGILRAWEIYKMKLPKTRLVVLSACRTATESSLNGEGAMGLARPFIAAKVPVVVGSLWSVDSDSTAELMIRFHRLRTRQKVRSVEALKLAQIELLKGSLVRYRHPYYWAGFTAIGGYAEF